MLRLFGRGNAASRRILGSVDRGHAAASNGKMSKENRNSNAARVINIDIKWQL